MVPPKSTPHPGRGREVPVARRLQGRGGLEPGVAIDPIIARVIDPIIARVTARVIDPILARVIDPILASPPSLDKPARGLDRQGAAW